MIGLLGILALSLIIGFWIKTNHDDKTFLDEHKRFMRKNFPNEGY